MSSLTTIPPDARAAIIQQLDQVRIHCEQAVELMEQQTDIATQVYNGDVALRQEAEGFGFHGVRNRTRISVSGLLLFGAAFGGILAIFTGDWTTALLLLALGVGTVAGARLPRVKIVRWIVIGAWVVGLYRMADMFYRESFARGSALAAVLVVALLAAGVAALLLIGIGWLRNRGVARQNRQIHALNQAAVDQHNALLARNERLFTDYAAIQQRLQLLARSLESETQGLVSA